MTKGIKKKFQWRKETQTKVRQFFLKFSLIEGYQVGSPSPNV